MRSYDAILEALNNHGKKVRRAGRKAMAQCPAHDDGRPSLSVTHDGDKTLIYCHAACPPGAIMAALDLPLSELWDDQREATFDNLIGYKLLIDAMPKLTVIDGQQPSDPIEYIYRDYDGNTIAKKVRYIGSDGKKTFRQYRYVDGNWLPGLDGIDLPLYNSDLIALAAASGQPIYVVEGEKDADTVTALGEFAVTMPNGAGSWNQRHTDQLTGITDIRIIIDRDEPGINHGIAVKQALEAAGATVTMLMPADGCKDITDHINANYAFDTLINADQQAAHNTEKAKQAKLQQLIDDELLKQQARNEARRTIGNAEAANRYALPDYTPSLTAELDKTDEPLRWLISNLWPEDANISLTAPYKGGKTTTANSVIKALADRQPLFGNNDYIIGDPGRIAIWNYEVSPNQYRQWLREADIRNTADIVVLNMRGHTWPIIHQYVIDATIQWLTTNNITTWIIDPLARAFVGCGDENSNADMGVFCDTLDYIKDQTGVRNLLVIAHTGRNSEAGVSRARGASRFDDWADARWTLTKDTATGNRYFSADGRDVSVEESYLQWNPDDRSQTIHIGQNKKEQIRGTKEDHIIDILQRHPDGLGLRQLAAALKDKYDSAYSITTSINDNANPLRAMLDKGIIHRDSNNIFHISRYQMP